MFRYAVPALALALTLVTGCSTAGNDVPTAPEGLTGMDSPEVTLAQPGSTTPPAGSASSSTASASEGEQGLTLKTLPDEDPGPPFYARVTNLLDQFFHEDGWLAIPFYRPPSCVPDDFNLLGLYDFPGPSGPGAFACPLLMDGFILIEPDAPLGTFPRQANLRGDQVPFWFVPWADFQAAMQDGVVTRMDLEAMDPVKGVAHRYRETLRPREGDHLIVIRAQGELEDGRSFLFQVNHHEAETRSIQVRFR